MSKTLKTILIILGIVALIGAGYAIAVLLQDNDQEQTLTFSIIVRAPGYFTIDGTPKNPLTGDIEVEVTKGEAAVFTFTATAVGGYDGKVRYEVDGLAEGTYALSANDVAPGVAVTLTVQTSGMTSNSTVVCGLTAGPA